jgi:hypothetical protein
MSIETVLLMLMSIRAIPLAAMRSRLRRKPPGVSASMRRFWTGRRFLSTPRRCRIVV